MALSSGAQAFSRVTLGPKPTPVRAPVAAATRRRLHTAQAVRRERVEFEAGSDEDDDAAGALDRALTGRANARAPPRARVQQMQRPSSGKGRERATLSTTAADSTNGAVAAAMARCRHCATSSRWRRRTTH